MSDDVKDFEGSCPYCWKRYGIASPEHLAALRAAIGMWNYMDGDYHGVPLATVPDTLRELLKTLEEQS